MMSTKEKHAAYENARYHRLTPEQKLARSRRAYTTRNARRRTDRSYDRDYEHKNVKWRSFLNKLWRYGLTLDQYHAMQESQDFVCAICSEESRGRKTGGIDGELVIDHHHEQDKVRALLCQECNIGIGRVGEANLQKAADYIKKYS